MKKKNSLDLPRVGKLEKKTKKKKIPWARLTRKTWEKNKNKILVVRKIIVLYVEATRLDKQIILG